MKIKRNNISSFNFKNTINNREVQFVKCKSDLKHYDVWQFRILETIVEREGYIYLERMLEPWQILEYQMYKILVRFKVIFRYCVSVPLLGDPLTSCDFVVYSKNRDVLFMFDCKFVNVRDLDFDDLYWLPPSSLSKFAKTWIGLDLKDKFPHDAVLEKMVIDNKSTFPKLGDYKDFSTQELSKFIKKLSKMSQTINVAPLSLSI